MTHFVLVHGAWHGAWCWEKLVPELSMRGHNMSAVDLPSASGAGNAGMYDDARVVSDHLALIARPVVLVAHSYGGIPATEAAATAANVTRIVYLAAFQLEAGDSLVCLSDGQLPTGVTGTMPPPVDPIATLFGDVPADDADEASRRLAPQTIRSFNETLSTAAWRTIPSEYVICEKDQALQVDDQEAMAERAKTVHRLPSSHSPFLSMPGELANVLSARR